MAIVLALMIVGWLVAFALGSQVGFDTQPDPAQSSSVEPTQANYREPASIA
jgi:hypothetical protein